jgi:CO/xanthine dehydrogenase FAD-binding subunit
LEKILLPPRAAAGYSSLAITKGDFSILVAAAAFAGGSWRVAVGARPGAARLSGLRPPLWAAMPARRGGIAEAAKACAADLDFGDDQRASSEYRRGICPVLVRRALEEALA